MRKKFQKGQYAVEYAMIAAVLTVIFSVEYTQVDGTAKSLLDNIQDTFIDLWHGFSFMVSLPLA